MGTLDPRKTADVPGTDPNKGLNTRKFLMAVIAALFVLMVILFVVAKKSPPKITPQRDDARPASGRSIPPAIDKPSLVAG